jgi:hypothetical protein
LVTRSAGRPRSRRRFPVINFIIINASWLARKRPARSMLRLLRLLLLALRFHQSRCINSGFGLIIGGEIDLAARESEVLA